MRAWIGASLELDGQVGVARDQGVPGEAVLEKLGTYYSAGESSCCNDRYERCGPSDSDEQDDECGESHSCHAYRAEDLAIVVNDSVRDCPPARKRGIIDRVPPGRIHQKQIADDQ